MYENCDIQIIEQPTYILRQMLEEDKLDLILDISSPDTINYESELLVKESFVLAIPDSLCPFSDPSQKEEDISATPQIHLPALSAIPFILLSEDHDLGKISRKICETAAFRNNYGNDTLSHLLHRQLNSLSESLFRHRSYLH